jgi:nucleoside phosphorylase
MMKSLACWQALDVLSVFEKMKTRPRGSLPAQVLWHNIGKGDVVSVGVNWLVSGGYAEMNSDQTAVILTEAGYTKITGNEFQTESTSVPISSNMRRAVILTALEVETRAVLRHVPGWRDNVVRDTVFYHGRFENWDIAIAEVGAGNYPAAVIAERAISHYDPEVALFVGVAGGVKDVALGDIVIATKIYGYEAGKETAEGFRTRPNGLVASHALEQRGRVLRQRSEWKARLNPQFAANEKRVHVGPIAAGEKVIASTQGPVALFLREHYGDTLAVEMEGRGFLEGVHVNAPVQGCVIRGISDLLEGKSSADAKGSQEIAADAASAIAFEILATLKPGDRSIPADSDRSSLEPRRIPITDLRSWATEAGWCMDAHAVPVGDNDLWTFAKRLRQAAVDGHIAFSGKRYLSDYGKELDSEPLLVIPHQHFEEFGFDVVQLAQADNYDIFTYSSGESQRTLRGQIFRDLHADAEQARVWLRNAGKPPPSAGIAIKLDTVNARIDDYRPVCSLGIENISAEDFDGCIVQIVDLSGVMPDGMAMPFVLRNDRQIRARERDKFPLSKRQKAVIPLIFQGPIRPNEWFFIDENGTKYFLPANPTKIIVRIYGGAAPGTALIFIDLDAGWHVFPSVKTVASDHTLEMERNLAPAIGSMDDILNST